jgi:hypothetical protein
MQFINIRQVTGFVNGVKGEIEGIFIICFILIMGKKIRNARARVSATVHEIPPIFGYGSTPGRFIFCQSSWGGAIPKKCSEITSQAKT